MLKFKLVLLREKKKLKCGFKWHFFSSSFAIYWFGLMKQKNLEKWTSDKCWFPFWPAVLIIFALNVPSYTTDALTIHSILFVTFNLILKEEIHIKLVWSNRGQNATGVSVYIYRFKFVCSTKFTNSENSIFFYH